MARQAKVPPQLADAQCAATDPAGDACPNGIGILPDELRVLGSSELFQGVSDSDAIAMLGCLGARRKVYNQGEYAMRSGDKATQMGLVLTGELSVEHVDVWGVRSILGTAGPADTFAEVFSCERDQALTVDIMAVQPTTALLLDVDRVMHTCPSACEFHARLVRNLLDVLATSNLRLTRKIESITPRTIRKRILCFLSQQATVADSRQFEIGFNRQQLADYLCVDRSALCHELTKMRDEGLIDFDRNVFRVLAR